MKYRTIAIIFLLIASFSYYYTNLVKTIPIELEASDKTITQVDKVRFTLKVGLLAKKAYATYLLGLKKEDTNIVNEALDYYDSAIGFAYIKYTQDDKLLDYVVPRLEQSISIIDKEDINITTDSLQKLTLINTQIGEFIQQNEQSTWTKIQNDYVEFRTDEVKSLVLFQVMFYMVLLFLIIMVIVLIQRARLHNENEELNEQLKEANLHLEEKVKSRTKELANKNDQLLEAQKISKLGSWSFNLIDNKIVCSDEVFNIYELDQTKFETTYENFANAIHPDDRDMVNKTYTNSLKKKEPYSIKYRILMDDGRVKWIKKECETSFDKDGTPLISKGIVQDITKDIENENVIKEQEKVIQVQSKIAAVGEMLSNIAHQWRQPLSIITMSASSVQMEYQMEGTASKDLVENSMNNIQKQAQYLSQTIDDFRDFFTADTNIKEEVNLKVTLEKILDLVKDSLKNNHIACEQEIEDIHIVVNENQLIQTLINICNNAKDALIENCLDSDERVISVKLKTEGDYALLIIQDSGGGIKEEIIDKIFDPYFTTKHQSIGTGIGLYMTYQIVTKHLDGTIKVVNSEFKYNGKTLRGAKFIIKLPLTT